MAPPIQKVKLQNTVYNVEILTGEMDSIAQQIQIKKEEIAEFTRPLTRRNQELIDLQIQLMTVYIQTTGGFPPS